jgi:hypothetical protein
MGRTKTFGGMPGEVKPYGFGSFDAQGAIFTVMNPGQAVEEIEMPSLSRVQPPLAGGRILFRDAGYEPVLSGAKIKLGPGQMAAAGFGRYADAKYDLGIQEDVRIPLSIRPLAASTQPAEGNSVTATTTPPENGDIRIILQQRGKDGRLMRSWPGGPPDGIPMDKVLTLQATQGGKSIPIEINYDKIIWSGLSWGVGEIRHNSLHAGEPVEIRCSSTEKNPVVLDCKLFVVQY